MKKVLSILLLSFIMLFVAFAPNTIKAEEEKIYYFANSAADGEGNRIVLLGKQIGLGPAAGVYDLVTDYYWSSNNPTVMSVVGGNTGASCIVKANKEGVCVVDCTTISVYYLNGTLWDTATMHNEHKFRVAAPINSIKFKKSTVSVKMNGTYQLKYTTSPSSIYSQYVSGLYFSSSNPNVATVDKEGKITAKNAGTVTITAATDNGLKVQCKVKVKRPKVKKVKLNKSKLTLEQGRKKKLKVKFSPSGATAKVKWKSSNKKVAKVNSKGVVVAKKAGKATITAKVSSKIYAKCKITVPKKPKSIKLNKSSLTLNKNTTYTLKYSLSPKKSYSKVSWSSSNSNVATVDKNGKVTAKSVGTAEITVKTLNGKKAVCKITVQNPPATSVKINKTKLVLSIAEYETLTATISPSDTTDKISWSSSNTKVATVDNEGKVTAIGVGKVTITAKATSGVFANCEVEVNNLPKDPNKYLTVEAKAPYSDERSNKYFYFTDKLGIGFTLYKEGATALDYNGVMVYAAFILSGEDMDIMDYTNPQKEIVYKSSVANEEHRLRISYKDKFYDSTFTEFTFYILYDGVKYKVTGDDYSGFYFTKEG